MTVANRNDDERRVVVTGMGIVTPIAETLDEYWASLLAGRSAITHWKHMDKRIASKIGGDLSDFDIRAHLERTGKGYRSDLVNRAHTILRSTPLAGCLTAAAALQAYTDAGLPDSRIEPERFGHSDCPRKSPLISCTSEHRGTEK